MHGALGSLPSTILNGCDESDLKIPTLGRSGIQVHSQQQTISEASLKCMQTNHFFFFLEIITVPSCLPETPPTSLAKQWMIVNQEDFLLGLAQAQSIQVRDLPFFSLHALPPGGSYKDQRNPICEIVSNLKSPNLNKTLCSACIHRTILLDWGLFEGNHEATPMPGCSYKAFTELSNDWLIPVWTDKNPPYCLGKVQGKQKIPLILPIPWALKCCEWIREWRILHDLFTLEGKVLVTASGNCQGWQRRMTQKMDMWFWLSGFT